MRNSDSLLRPKTLSGFIGQKKVVTKLATVIKAAQKQRQPCGHLLLSGPPGLGKTTLANVTANEMDCPIWATVGGSLGAQLQDHETLFNEIFPTFEHGGIIFVDEIHAIDSNTQDTLLPLLEQNYLSLKYRAPKAREGKRKGDWETLSGKTKDFTFIGSTTQAGKLSEPFRDRFKLNLRLDFYSDEAMYQIARRTAYLLRMSISKKAIMMFSVRAKGTPRLVNNALWYAQQWEIAHDKHINEDRAKIILNELGIDDLGLDKMDRRLLEYLVELDGPAGLTTLAAALAEDKSTIQNVLEPYLLRAGLLLRTPRGRMASDKARKHILKGANDK